MTGQMARSSRSSRWPLAAAMAGVLALSAALSSCGVGGTADAVANAAPDAPINGPQGRVPQFIASCAVSHFAFDDPIVHPGHAGASHQHVFFGNEAVTASVGYDELLGAPTTCDQRLDTASYWTPVLLDPRGQRIDPMGAVAYYRPGAGVDHTTLVPYPPDLKMVAGDAEAGGEQPLSVVAWSCGVSAVRSVVPTECPGRSTLRLLVTFPDCWDGERTWAASPDDRHPDDRHPDDRHVVYSSAGECPDSHPVPIPQLQLAVDHPPVDPEGLTLSSGAVTTGHADFWNAWDQDKLVNEVQNCLHRGITCNVSAN